MSQDKSKESAVELLNLIQERQETKSPELAAKQARLLALLKADAKTEPSLFEQFAARGQELQNQAALDAGSLPSEQD